MVQEETYNHAAIIKPAKKYLKAKNDRLHKTKEYILLSSELTYLCSLLGDKGDI